MDPYEPTGDKDFIELPEDLSAEQAPVVGLDRELLQKHREMISSRTETNIVEEPSKNHHVSEMGQKIINMFTNPDHPHPHCVGYKSLIENLIERNRRRFLDPTCTPPHFPSSDMFANNRAQYVYSMDDPPGTAPVLEIKSKAEVDQTAQARRRMIVHVPSEEVMEKIRTASQRSKKKKKDKKSDAQTDTAKSESSKELQSVAVDDDLDIFAGLEISSDTLTKAGIETGPLFSEFVPGNAPAEQDLNAIRSRLVDAARIREQSRAGIDSAGQKRTLRIAEDDVMADASNFGQKIDAESFVFKEDDEPEKSKRPKARKKGDAKRP